MPGIQNLRSLDSLVTLENSQPEFLSGLLSPVPVGHIIIIRKNFSLLDFIQQPDSARSGLEENYMN